jgi:precorrin-2 dehydrogenase/sirohydrochlorin ferrochelatase
MIPLLHDFDGETVLVAGGGSVGARKARRFAREARVLVLAPSFADADFGDAERIRAALAPESVAQWLDRTDPALAVAATDDTAVNDALASAARERGLLVNRADRAGERDAGSVVVPATVREDPVVAAIATGGTSPALSRHLRGRIEPILEDAGSMATLTGEIRTELRERGVDPGPRRDAVRAVVRSDAVWTALDRGSANARATAADVVAATTGESL